MLIERFALNSMGTNTYVIADRDSGEAIILDPCAADMAPVIAYVADHDLKVQAIVNTHCHFDHVLGNEPLRAHYHAPLWLHRAELALLRDVPERMHALFGMSVETRDPDRFLEAEEVLTLGQEVRLRLLLTPGHSPGGLCLYDEQAGVLFSGDTLFAGTIGRTDLPGSSHADLMASLRDQLWPLPDATVVYPGHEEDTTIGEERMVNPFFRF